jgi:hypothetical protein
MSEPLRQRLEQLAKHVRGVNADDEEHRQQQGRAKRPRGSGSSRRSEPAAAGHDPPRVQAAADNSEYRQCGDRALEERDVGPGDLDPGFMKEILIRIASRHRDLIHVPVPREAFGPRRPEGVRGRTGRVGHEPDSGRSLPGQVTASNGRNRRSRGNPAGARQQAENRERRKSAADARRQQDRRERHRPAQRPAPGREITPKRLPVGYAHHRSSVRAGLTNTESA